jgi:hypothetical protein
MIRALLVLTLLFLTSGIVQAEPRTSKPAPKPVLIVQPDGLPAGHATPEGAACDLARAFMTSDVALFKSTCIKPFGAGNLRRDYSAFLQQTSAAMAREAKSATPNPTRPKTVGKLWASRPLSHSGPASEGYALYNFKDIRFVDVGVFLYNGERSITRTMVIQDANGQWFVFPTPDLAPTLSYGLNQEPDSKIDFTAAYTVKQAVPPKKTH